MKALVVCWLMVMVCASGLARAQGTLEPLLLFVKGSGSVTPYQSGDLLEDGQNYSMTAAPADGFTFVSWQPVNVFISTMYISGSPVSTVTPSPVPEYTYTPTLMFNMQASQEIFNDPGIRTITQSFGWKANFAPVPEPSAPVLAVGGMVVLWLMRGCKRRGNR